MIQKSYEILRELNFGSNGTRTDESGFESATFREVNGHFGSNYGTLRQVFKSEENYTVLTEKNVFCEMYSVLIDKYTVI